MAPSEPTVGGVDTDGMSAYLAQTTVEFVILFGSHAYGTISGSSDVDVALRFPEEMEAYERFRLRNRIDAELQQYAESFVDVSDIDSLPTSVAYAVLRDGVLLMGDESVAKAYREQVEQEYNATKEERDQARKELIDRLAKGNAKTGPTTVQR